MMMKELTYDVTRHMTTYPEGPAQFVDAPLTLTFLFRAAAGASGDVLARYNGACLALSQLIGGLLSGGRLLLGATQNVIHRGGHTRLGTEADCGSFGTDLIRNICPPVVEPFGFKIERLNVAFGVYEKASCYPRREAVVECAYDTKMSQKGQP